MDQIDDKDEKELKHRKEQFRVEIRKNKQHSTLSANRIRISKRLFFEETIIGDTSSSSLSIQPFSIPHQPNHGRSIFDQSPSSSSQSSSIFQQTSSFCIPSSNIIISQDHFNLIFQQLIKESLAIESAGASQWSIQENIAMLQQYEDLFKNAKPLHVASIESLNVHIRLFQHLQWVLANANSALQQSESLAETLLAKIFQYLVSSCLHSEKVLNDCFTHKIIDYFLNVMISSTFFAKQSRIIVYSAMLLDHVTALAEQTHLEALAEKEFTRQILSLAKDVQTALASSTNNITASTHFHLKLLAHLSSILTHITLNKGLLLHQANQQILDTAQPLFLWTATELDKINSKELPADMEDSDESPANSNDMLDTQDTPLKDKLQLGIIATREELERIEANLGGSILNILEMLESDELDMYIDEHVTFIVDVQQRITPATHHTQKTSSRVQIYADLINSLLLGDSDQVQLIIDNFGVLESLHSLVDSPVYSLLSTGLAGYHNILANDNCKEQLEAIYEEYPAVLSRITLIVEKIFANSQLSAQSMSTLASFIDVSDRDQVDSVLQSSNIINVIVQRMDPDNNDVSVIKQSLCLLESLLRSHQNGGAAAEEEEEAEEEDEMDEDSVDDGNEDNLWAQKLQQHPAIHQIISRIFTSKLPQDIILKMDDIVDEFISNP